MAYIIIIIIIISKLNDGIGFIRGHTVVDEQGGLSTHPPRGPCVEGQRGAYAVSYHHHLGAACKEVQDPVAEGGFQSQRP
jgi:hypothetical protein